METDHFKHVPQDFVENLSYRRRLRKKCATDATFRKHIWQACKEDVLFFFSTMCWLYEPRVRFRGDKRLPHEIPMIPWDHQVPIIREIRENLGVGDIGLEKSRGEGASWIAILLAVHDWVFNPMSLVGLVSRNEETADSPKDPASLFWKIDWELTKLPGWMVGEKGVDYTRNLDKHSLLNHKNGASIVAYAATGNVGRAGRYTWFLMDELAFFPRPQDEEAVRSTQASSDSRLYVSTPNGSEGKYYNLMHEPSNMVKLQMHWSQNNSRNRGLYKFVKGKAIEHDPVNNPLPANYITDNNDMFSRLRLKGFNLEKGWRSPWYDRECDRPGATPQDIAQELDIDYSGSKHLVFGTDFFAKAQSRQPEVKCHLSYHPETLELDVDRTWDGQCKIWCPLTVNDEPPFADYVMGADVGSGLGGSYTSNSVVEVVNVATGEQVLEFATNTMPPSDFADLCVAIGHWFFDAYLAWEHNGPGSAMTRRVVELGYPNVYRRTSLWRRGTKKETAVGWWTDQKSKEVMFAELIRQVKAGETKIFSKALIEECRQYIYLNGVIEHAQAKTTSDDSSKGQAHGDRVIAMAVALMAMKDRPKTSVTSDLKETLEEIQHSNPPRNTLAWRMAQQLAPQDSVWDDRTNGELRTPGTFEISEGLGWED